ncbi:CHASE domain-containing protein [Cognatishimia sp. SS12]|uniref:CHASE domain-containing protein n=1 Tax=Cognatishimia sp. SS12 TaxID=2979465 RepID=UPI00232FA9FF|nr:CHASE domain-containing protein [Cognatishimia sp. SS12]MDC0738477.1 CHASE domain-containing protein [Cognatishimia sp. SS12]
METIQTFPAEAGRRGLTAFGARLSILHILIIVLSLAMTIAAWQFSEQQIKNRSLQRFELAVERTIGLLEDRMENYEDALWAGVALLAVKEGDISGPEWRAYENSLALPQKYPGINGIGVIYFLAPEEVPAFIEKQRAENPNFTIFPAHENPEIMPITFIEPRAPNAKAVGLDVAHEANRRLAALSSRDTGKARITGPIVLVQDEGSTAGFLFYAPFYAAESTTLAERRENGIGVVYAPFVVRKLMEGLLEKTQRQLRFNITDAGQAIYDEFSDTDDSLDPNPMYEGTYSISIYGRVWTLDVRTNLHFRDQNTYAQPYFILAGGLVIEVLVILLIVLLARANRRAISYAAEVSADLRHKKDKLARINEELEQFAYVTSHDLKTPIRGIGGLTEMIQEDLEEYFASPKANPDVQTNLNRIMNRVDRMNELTRGVMEFSRIGRSAKHADPFSLPDFVDTLLSDFSLSKNQILLISDIEEITFDPMNFRRVVENLVSNAVKYHEDLSKLFVTITVHRKGDMCSVSVKDNGPGIDPRFHERIFDMFQSLKSGEGQDGTGIGLAIVKKSVELHGGTVRITSDIGAGAEFCFDWPLTAQAPFHMEHQAA